jgi:hypothetical protein
MKVVKTNLKILRWNSAELGFEVLISEFPISSFIIYILQL